MLDSNEASWMICEIYIYFYFTTILIDQCIVYFQLDSISIHPFNFLDERKTLVLNAQQMPFTQKKYSFLL